MIGSIGDHTELLTVILAVADGLDAKQKHKRAAVLRTGMLKHKFEENEDGMGNS